MAGKNNLALVGAVAAIYFSGGTAALAAGGWTSVAAGASIVGGSMAAYGAVSDDKGMMKWGGLLALGGSLGQMGLRSQEAWAPAEGYGAGGWVKDAPATAPVVTATPQSTGTETVLTGAAPTTTAVPAAPTTPPASSALGGYTGPEAEGLRVAQSVPTTPNGMLGPQELTSADIFKAQQAANANTTKNTLYLAGASAGTGLLSGLAQGEGQKTAAEKQVEAAAIIARAQLNQFNRTQYVRGS